MNYYYITGTSKGIGRALVEHLLTDPSNKVVGISRSREIKHSNYEHVSLDLSNIDEVSGFHFVPHHDATRIVLINNAGALGAVRPVGKLTAHTIAYTYNLNLVSPGILINNFINVYDTVPVEKMIVNISSGAGKYPIDGWSVYCASKAGLDMFSRVVAEEQKINKARKRFDFRIFSVAPGVVDTEMQGEIRTADKTDFSRLDDFINYKSSGQLADPRLLAEKFFRILADAGSINETVISVRDFD
jgi:benzil reductase ((S)-benzoin forming)